MEKTFCLRCENKSLIIRGALGHSLMVELRTLTPSVLVRIQLPQPRILSVISADCKVKPCRLAGCLFCFWDTDGTHGITNHNQIESFQG